MKQFQFNTSHRQDFGYIAIHRGMTMAVYPFWSAVAATVGRLLNLQGTAASPRLEAVRHSLNDDLIILLAKRKPNKP